MENCRHRPVQYLNNVLEQDLAVAARISFGGLAGLALLLFLFVSPTGFIVANSIAGACFEGPIRERSRQCPKSYEAPAAAS